MSLRIFPTVLIFLLLLPGWLPAQDDFSDQVLVVLLGINSPKDATLCYSSRFDKKTVRKTYDFEDTINYLSDYAYEEEEMYGPDCFIPEMKLVFRHYTYVLSLYCTRAIKYKNSAPFKPSSTRMPNDLVFTHSVYEYLSWLRRNEFGSLADAYSAERLVEEEPLQDLSDNEYEDLLFEDDDDLDEFDLDDEDSDLFKDTHEFDDVDIDDDDLLDDDLDEFDDDYDNR